MVILANVTCNTARSVYDPTTTGTSPPLLNLTGVYGHIEPVQINQLQVLPQAALDVLYVLNVTTGTDIIVGDVITDLTLPDGVTPWPGAEALGSNITWVVRHAQESAPIILPSRMVYLAAVYTGAPAT